VGVKVRKRNSKWYVVIDFHGRRKSKCVGTREAAEKVKREIESRLTLGDLGVFAQPKKAETFRAYAERWLKTEALQRCKISTVDFYEDYLKRYVWPLFGTRRSRRSVGMRSKNLPAAYAPEDLPKTRFA